MVILHSRKTQVLAGLVLLSMAAGAVVTAENPVVRHRIGAWLGKSAHRIAANRHREHASEAHPSIVDVRAEPSRIAEQPLDGRFVTRPSADVASPLSPVDVTGHIALLPSVEAKGTTADAALEPAALPAAPGPTGAGTAAVDADFANAHQAITLYRKGSVAQGDEFAKTVGDPVVRIALEWVALRFDPHEAGLSRLQSFVMAHADWPTAAWLGRRMEEIAVAETRDPASILARFASGKPQTLIGKLALARADLASDDVVTAAALVRDIWRNADLTVNEETTILKEFGSLIGRDDHKYRADRLLYKEQVAPALRAASLAGPDVRLLATARATVVDQAGPAASDSAIAAVPKFLAGDPGLTFSRIQKARRASRFKDAVDLMLKAPRDPGALINGDEWWVERRLLARKMLDMGDPHTAYTLCADHVASSDASTIEAEFHAGWIALRFLDEAKVASTHFARAAINAETPISRARVAYWQARAADAAGDKEAAATFYGMAAAQPISFYGQLAMGRMGRTTIDLRQPNETVAGNDRHEAIRVVEQLYALGERDIAMPLAIEVAKTESSDAQIAALASILTKANDARATLLVGKIGTQRGLPLDEIAFPTFGIPGYQPLTNSADRAVVYAIARQESEFDPRSVSSAGAKGLMQLITSTARQTAVKLGVSYDDTRLLSDAAFNAQIGAAHLGQLLSEQRGSYILTFAAYNAGSQRVKDWIDAYGDPRKPGVDPVDWIERIPFTETRNYVQRVFENLQIYRSRFGQSSILLVGADLTQRGKGT